MQEDQKLDELTNEELVLYAAGGCDRARNLMMEKNEGLAVSKAKIYWEGIYSSGIMSFAKMNEKKKQIGAAHENCAYSDLFFMSRETKKQIL